MKSQVELIHGLLGRRRFCLVILDSCRADYFKREWPFGKVEEVKSPAPCTIHWLERVFPGWYDLVYVSANPFVSSRGKPPHSSYEASRHFRRVVDVWRFAWDWEVGTVPPWAVTRVARLLLKGGEDRLVVHYIQPHYPYVALKGRVKGWSMEEFKNAVPGPQQRILDALRRGKVTVEEVREAYLANLRWVLRCLVDLIFECARREIPIVVTSDHGEYLGEGGSWFHEPWHRGREVEVVPWVELRRRS